MAGVVHERHLHGDPAGGIPPALGGPLGGHARDGGVDPPNGVHGKDGIVAPERLNHPGVVELAEVVASRGTHGAEQRCIVGERGDIGRGEDGLGTGDHAELLEAPDVHGIGHLDVLHAMPAVADAVGPPCRGECIERHADGAIANGVQLDL